MEKYISVKIDKNWTILVPRVNLYLQLGTVAPGHERWRFHGGSCIDVLRHIFKILISINYKNIQVY